MRPVLSHTRPYASTWLDESLTLARHPDGRTADEAGPDRWLATEAAFADTGGLVSGDELADLLRQQVDTSWQLIAPQPVSLVARWIVAQMVVTIESPRGWMLPLFQFDLPRASVHHAMRPLLAELRGALDDTELALWFVSPNEWLGGACPARAMHSFLPAVRMAARTDRYVAMGG